MGRICQVKRVFTRGKLGGNHLGIITDLEGLDTAAMQQIAAELGFSETIFIDQPTSPVPYIRIFTPTEEMPFAGHPLVGAAATLSPDRPDQGHAPFPIRCPVGEVMLRAHPPYYWISPPFGQTVRSGTVDFPSELGVSDSWEVLMPLPYQVVRLGSPEEVASLEIPPPEWGTVYVWAWIDRELIKARFFAHGLGVVEDPATGSAAVAWAASQLHQGQTKGHATVWQGDEIGHPSTLEVFWEPDRVEIGGRVMTEPDHVLTN